MVTPANPRPDVTYRYTFIFKDGTSLVFTVRLDGETLTFIPESGAETPEWTRLGFHQCPNCPLDPAQHPYCPVARNLVPVLTAFRERHSFESVVVTVESRNRAYTREGSIQTSVAPLVGLHMATSGCPVLDRLRPLAETHLPFMSRHETMYRTVTLHVLSQFFAQRRGELVPFDLETLRARMDEIHAVNVAFCDRLRAISTQDANVNAVVILSTLADFPSQQVTEQDLARLERLLKDYYER
jgi:hypothetical protein